MALPSGAAAPWSPPSLQEWLRGRPGVLTRDRSPNPYPVYVVAAAGGGLRAAYWTAMVLSSIQDRCPAFAEHVHAISGVSGGAVGAAVFAALVRRDELARGARTPADRADRACRGGDSQSPGPLQTFADRVLRRDLLSPALVAGLGPDLLQRFLPWPIASFDRARALERALEQLSAYVYRTAADGGGTRVIPFLLCDARSRVPLGWLLSERSRRAMQAAIADPRPCDASPNAVGDAATSNAESLRQLVADFGFVLPTR